MRSLVLALAFSTAATALAAQTPAREEHKEMSHGMMAAKGPLKSIMPFAPEALLKHAEHLGLTPDQVGKLTALKDRATADAKAVHEPGHTAHMNLNRTLKETPGDTTAIREFFMEHHQAMGRMEWIHGSAAFQARALLTPEQIKLVESMARDGKGHEH